MDTIPSDLLVRIVSFLPFKDQVRSSSVARRWKELWKETGYLDFDCVDFNRERNHSLYVVSDLKFTKAINRSLDQQLFPIRSFRLTFPARRFKPAAFNGWLNKLHLMSGAGGHGLRELDIDLLSGCPYLDRDYHHIVFPAFRCLRRLSLKNFSCKPDFVPTLLESCCDWLEDLCLVNFRVPEELHVRGDALKNLRLRSISSGEYSGQLIVHAPNLVLFDFVGWQELEMETPKLRSLNYEGRRQRFARFNAPPSLSTAAVKILRPNSQGDPGLVVADMLMDLKHVKLLEIDFGVLFSLVDFSPTRRSTVFTNLETLVVVVNTLVFPRWTAGMSVLLQIIGRKPKHLTLKVPETHSNSERSFWSCVKHQLEGSCGLACNLETFKTNQLEGLGGLCSAREFSTIMEAPLTTEEILDQLEFILVPYI